MGTTFWIIAGVVALAVAAFNFLLWPARRLRDDDGRLRRLVLRWGHTLVWLLLAVAFFLLGTGSPSLARAANVVALLAFGSYLAFLAAMFWRGRA